ncbi:MAG: YCF48-related protein, partial [Candidatus Krumholzibacteria bacterium]|nr:YCF48-related protein [Candidatus Krumholzibacteria bacterium]
MIDLRYLVSPAGGTFSGGNVTSNGMFDISAAGVGTHAYSYSYTDGNSQTSSCDGTITVTAVPPIPPPPPAPDGWFWSHPYPTGSSLFAVFFTDANTGTAVGGGGVTGDATILRTPDGGKTWTNQVSGWPNSLGDVWFMDSMTAVAVSLNAILRTTDAGANWEVISVPFVRELQSVSFADGLVGTVVGRDGVILRTTDGGQTWVSQVSGTNRLLLDVSFASVDTA